MGTKVGFSLQSHPVNQINMLLKLQVWWANETIHRAASVIYLHCLHK